MLADISHWLPRNVAISFSAFLSFISLVLSLKKWVILISGTVAPLGGESGEEGVLVRGGQVTSGREFMIHRARPSTGAVEGGGQLGLSQ